MYFTILELGKIITDLRADGAGHAWDVAWDAFQLERYAEADNIVNGLTFSSIDITPNVTYDPSLISYSQWIDIRQYCNKHVVFPQPLVAERCSIRGWVMKIYNNGRWTVIHNGSVTPEIIREGSMTLNLSIGYYL